MLSEKVVSKISMNEQVGLIKRQAARAARAETAKTIIINREGGSFYIINSSVFIRMDHCNHIRYFYLSFPSCCNTLFHLEVKVISSTLHPKIVFYSFNFNINKRTLNPTSSSFMGC